MCKAFACKDEETDILEQRLFLDVPSPLASLSRTPLWKLDKICIREVYKK